MAAENCARAGHNNLTRGQKAQKKKVRRGERIGPNGGNCCGKHGTWFSRKALT